MADQYVLDKDGNPVAEPDPIKLAKQFEDSDDSRRGAREKVGTVTISTVFLGLNYNFLGNGPPILYETMVFGGALNGEMDRYPTWDAAKKGHRAMVDRVKEAQTEAP